MMNGTQYVESLKKLKPRIFYRGKRLEKPYDHPALATPRPDRGGDVRPGGGRDSTTRS